MPRKTRPKSKHKKRSGSKLRDKRPERDLVSARPGASRANILHNVLKGIFFIVIVLSIKLLIEQTRFGKHLELMGYNFLQTRLSPQPVPLTVVDISDLPAKDFVVNGQTVTATPRESLREMAEALADQHARAIGIDVDFSPDESGYILPSDPEFFQSCLDLRERRGVPVFLGIKRTLVKPPAEWLGDEKYEDLGASILVPRDSRRMASLIEVEDEKSGTTTPAKAMSVRLAESYGEKTSQSESSFLHDWIIGPLGSLKLIEKLSEKKLASGIAVQDFLIDYGPLESIERVSATDAAVLRDPDQRSLLQDKIVLIGDATLGKASDTFVVPGRDQPVPGIMVHACATYTMLKAPLFELTAKGHIFIDILLSSLILAAVVLIGLRFGEHATEKYQKLITWLVVLSAIVIGVVFVRVTRIMWDDFFLSLILLVFHPSIERQTESLWSKIRKRRTPNSELEQAGKK